MPGSNFAPFEEVKVPVSNSAELSHKSDPWRIFEDLGVVRVNFVVNNKKHMLFIIYFLFYVMVCVINETNNIPVHLVLITIKYQRH